MDTLKIYAEVRIWVQLGDSRKTEERVGETVENGDKPITKQVDEVVTAEPQWPQWPQASLLFASGLCPLMQTVSMLSDKAAKGRNSHLQRAFLGSAKHG